MTLGETDDDGFLRVTMVALDDSGFDSTSLPGGYGGQLLAGQYRIGRVIGRGGASEVYVAEDGAGRAWAVKVLLPNIADDPEHTRRFKREARAAALMDHPNVLPVVKLVEDVSKGVFFIVMELGVGRSLASVVVNAGGAPLPLSFVGDVALAVLDVTAFAHDRSVVHRDLKPENVFLVDDGPGRFVPKVLDFGLARIAGDAGGHSVTGPSMIRGTPAYMSPEQCRSLAEVGPETDVYALGCLLFELLTGQIPFDAASSMEILARHMFAAVPALRRPDGAEPLPDGLAALVASMMAKDPRARPTAAAARASLGALLASAKVSLGTFASPAPPAPPQAASAPELPDAPAEKVLAGKRIAIVRLQPRHSLVDAVIDGLTLRGARVDHVPAEGVAVISASALVIDAGDDSAAAFALAARVRRARPSVKIVVACGADAAGAPPGVVCLSEPVTVSALVDAVSPRR